MAFKIPDRRLRGPSRKYHQRWSTTEVAYAYIFLDKVVGRTPHPETGVTTVMRHAFRAMAEAVVKGGLIEELDVRTATEALIRYRPDDIWKGQEEKLEEYTRALAKADLLAPATDSGMEQVVAEATKEIEQKRRAEALARIAPAPSPIEQVTESPEETPPWEQVELAAGPKTQEFLAGPSELAEYYRTYMEEGDNLGQLSILAAMRSEGDSEHWEHVSTLAAAGDYLRIFMEWRDEHGDTDTGPVQGGAGDAEADAGPLGGAGEAGPGSDPGDPGEDDPHHRDGGAPAAPGRAPGPPDQPRDEAPGDHRDRAQARGGAGPDDEQRRPPGGPEEGGV